MLNRRRFTVLLALSIVLLLPISVYFAVQLSTTPDVPFQPAQAILVQPVPAVAPSSTAPSRTSTPAPSKSTTRSQPAVSQTERFLRVARQHCAYTPANRNWWLDGETRTDITDTPLFKQACPGKDFKQMLALKTTPATTTTTTTSRPSSTSSKDPYGCLAEQYSNKTESQKRCAFKYYHGMELNEPQCWLAYHLDEGPEPTTIDPEYKDDVDKTCAKYGSRVR